MKVNIFIYLLYTYIGTFKKELLLLSGEFPDAPTFPLGKNGDVWQGFMCVSCCYIYYNNYSYYIYYNYNNDYSSYLYCYIALLLTTASETLVSAASGKIWMVTCVERERERERGKKQPLSLCGL